MSKLNRTDGRAPAFFGPWLLPLRIRAPVLIAITTIVFALLSVVIPDALAVFVAILVAIVATMAVERVWLRRTAR